MLGTNRFLNKETYNNCQYKRQPIPMYIKCRNRERDFLEVTNMMEADYVFFDIIESKTYPYQTGFDIYYNTKFGMCLGRFFKFDIDIYIFYIRINVSTFLDKRLNHWLGGLMVGNLRGFPANQEDWYKDKKVKFEKSGEKFIFDPKIILRYKISSDHHTYIKPREILAVQYNNKILNNISKKVGVVYLPLRNIIDHKLKAIYDKLKSINMLYESTLSTMWLYVLIAPEYASDYLIWLFRSIKNEEDLHTILKYEGRAAKQLQYLNRDDLNHIFELNVLVNRIDTSPDWNTEIKKRIKPNTVLLPSGYVRKAAIKIFRQALRDGQIPEYTTWEKYWKRRWAKLPSGSFFAVSDKLKRQKKLFNRDVRNKTTVLSSLKEYTLTELLNNKPETVAKGSIKYEWGKTRAIYGCNVENYLIFDLMLGSAEELLPAQFVVGTSATKENVLRKVNVLSKGIPFCFDYDDFNSQHSFQSMREVVDAWYSVYNQYLSQDQQRCFPWIMNAINDQHMIIEQKDSKEKYKIFGTMFSGHRMTSWWNSVLNRVYLEYAGLLKYSAHSIHNGDDVLASLEYFCHGREILKNCEKFGIRAQITKCAIGTIGEFLRMDGLSKNPTGTQYLTRACATAAHGRIEVSAPKALDEFLEAVSNRYDAMAARGGNQQVLKNLRTQNLEYASKIFETDIKVLEAYFYYHPLQGGRNVQGTIHTTCIEHHILDRRESEIKHFTDLMEPGVQDYVNFLCKTYDIDISNVNRDIIRRDVIKTLGGVWTNLRLVQERRKYLPAKRGIYKAWATKNVIYNLAQLRITGFLSSSVIDKRYKGLFEFLRERKDIIDIMKIIT